MLEWNQKKKAQSSYLAGSPFCIEKRILAEGFSGRYQRSSQSTLAYIGVEADLGVAFHRHAAAQVKLQVISRAPHKLQAHIDRAVQAILIRIQHL